MKGDLVKKLGIIVTALAVLALPAGAAAKPGAKADKRNAAKECKAERAAMGEENFATTYGKFGKCVKQARAEARAERKQARRQAVQDCRDQGLKGREFGKCVKSQAKQNKAEAKAEDEAEDAEEMNAAKTCRAEQAEIGEEAFAEKYGTNRNKRNAFGKCVSAHAEAQGDDEGELEEEDENENELEGELEDENEGSEPTA